MVGAGCGNVVDVGADIFAAVVRTGVDVADGGVYFGRRAIGWSVGD